MNHELNQSDRDALAESLDKAAKLLQTGVSLQAEFIAAAISAPATSEQIPQALTGRFYRVSAGLGDIGQLLKSLAAKIKAGATLGADADLQRIEDAMLNASPEAVSP